LTLRILLAFSLAASEDRIPLTEIRDLVSKEFYSPSIAAEALRELDAPGTGNRLTVARDALKKLHASHTALFTRNDWDYWALLSIFEANIASICPDPKRLPPLPIRIGSIGAFWKNVEGQWFVVSVIPGGEADKVGLKRGDEVVSADGRPFAPVALSGTASHEALVELGVRRSSDQVPLRLRLKPRLVSPMDEFVDSISRGSRTLTVGKHRVGYVPIFSWTGDETQEAVVNAIVTLNSSRVDAWIIDLRDGFGGANPEFASVFQKGIPTLTTIGRDGAAHSRDTQLHGDVIVLTNEGTRSGKEVIAYAVKRNGSATLVGSRTAGAVLVGRPFCLSDGSLLYLAVADVLVDGERLEGRGVAPDVEVPFDVRYANGSDAQLQAALKRIGAR
jgi:carboxyl-terminal processing protease